MKAAHQFSAGECCKGINIKDISQNKYLAEDVESYKFCNQNIRIILEGDGNFIQDWSKLLAVSTPRRIKLEQNCKIRGIYHYLTQLPTIA